MYPKKDYQKEIDKLKDAKTYGHSRIDHLQEERRIQEEKDAIQASKRAKRFQEEDEDFVDDQEISMKHTRKVKVSAVDEDYDDEDVNKGYDKKSIKIFQSMKPSADHEQRKANPKQDQESKAIMDDLFETLEAPAPVTTVLHGQTNYRFNSVLSQEPRSFQNAMDEEITKSYDPPSQPGMMDVEAELDDLERLEEEKKKKIEQTHTTSGLGITAKANISAGVQQSTYQPSQSSQAKRNQHLKTVSTATPADISHYSNSLYCKKKCKDINFTYKYSFPDSNTKFTIEKMGENQSAQFYWTDIQEDFKKRSQIFVYGKVRASDEKGKSRDVSACLIVKNICRTIYIIKRPEDKFSLDDVEKEILQKIQKKHSFGNEIKIKKITDRYYNFELDIARGNVEALQIKYSFDLPELRIDFAGQTYNGIIGTTYKPSELFVLTNKLMGPCWIDVDNFEDCSDQKQSSCRVEMKIDSLSDVGPSKKGIPTPKFSIASVSLVKEKANEGHISTIVLLYNSDYDIENVQANVPTIPFVFTVLDNSLKDKKQMFEKSFGTNVEFVMRETALINCFLQKLNRLDPDIIISHDAKATFFETIISKISQLGIINGNLLSRSNKDFKFAFKKDNKMRIFTQGRMVCDTLMSSKEIIREKNFDLNSLAEKHLKENDLMQFQTAPSDFVKQALHNIDQSIMEASLTLRLCQKLQLIQLNKQLTTEAGCFLYQSFQNLRAERNEMLLMHVFSRSKFILPDKFYNDKKFQGGKKGKKKEKAKYAGGLVLEPKSGLYRDYILLLDFNSLYPSIIREYKICFTTVDRDYVDITFYKPDEKGPSLKEADEDEDDGDEEDQEKLLATTRIPNHEVSQVKNLSNNQILPKIIEKLISKRKEIKNELKKCSDPTQKETLDIKQKAVKLIANSIYGCLGFKSSRFYAKQLAALITKFGRTILEKTAKQVEASGYEVIYGDTDSIMINSRTKDLMEAIQKALSIKKDVNHAYKKKIMEIDLDGVFRSLLLLKKKKYAADSLVNLGDVMAASKDSVAKFGVELKGLDIVRRDWCGLTKETGGHLINLILDQSLDPEDVITKIYDHLANLKRDLDANRVPLDSFIIYKELKKNPEQYSGTGQPHVCVAKKMLRSGYTKEQLINHYIPYVVCAGDPSINFAERAYHPDEIRQQKLKPDISYYTNNQLTNSLSRTLEYLPGIDMEKVSELLGIDKRKMNQHLENKQEFAPTEGMESSILYSDQEIPANLITWVCPNCGTVNSIKINATTLACKGKVKGIDCGNFPSEAMIKNGATLAIKKAVQEYYKGVFSLSKKGNENFNDLPDLPLFKSTAGEKTEQSLTGAVSKVNAKLFFIETVFQSANKLSSEGENVRKIMESCLHKIQNLRRQSAYEKIKFGGIAAIPKAEKMSLRHYQFFQPQEVRA